MSERDILDAFIRESMPYDSLHIEGVWTFEITRADGTKEVSVVKNTLTSEGLNHLALRGINNTGSAFLYMAIGTQTEASSLGSTQAGLGEVSRKLMSTATTSKEFMIGVATWAGAADSLSSVDLRTAGLFNHANSGSGISLNFVNSVATILADSDFLKVQAEIRIGSHNL